MSLSPNIGYRGENLAQQFLKENGYDILECNWRYKHLEADVIARYNDLLVIVEVKTRKNNYFGEPEENVHQKKQKNLIDIANAYIELNNLDFEIRFDIISIILDEAETKIHHIKEAFSAMD